MCCDSYDARPEDTVGECPGCGGAVDKDGESTEEGCNYSPEDCSMCHSHYCDQSC